MSFKVGIWNNPSNCLLLGRILGIRSLTLRVFNSAKVKSSANHPVTELPSIILVVFLSANLSIFATLVVPDNSFSWRATNTLSLVTTKSGSIKSAPKSIANS